MFIEYFLKNPMFSMVTEEMCGKKDDKSCKLMFLVSYFCPNHQGKCSLTSE
jgi:hypothetical protein